MPKQISKVEVISPTRVRYIKLGEGGRWEKHCLDRGLLRLGFGTGTAERFRQCSRGQWDALTARFIARGKDKGTATRHTNEIRAFFEDDGSTLWITFIGERLCWGFVDKRPPRPVSALDGSCRAIKGGWRWTDLKGEPLTKERLSGSLTKLTAYRGTSCAVQQSDYVVRRINGHKIPEVERALAATATIKVALLDVIQLLEPRDFELLVDLVFTTSGWRRVGVVERRRRLSTWTSCCRVRASGPSCRSSLKRRHGNWPITLLDFQNSAPTIGCSTSSTQVRQKREPRM